MCRASVLGWCLGCGTGGLTRPHTHTSICTRTHFHLQHPWQTAAVTAEVIWKTRLVADLGVVRAGSHAPGFSRNLYLDIVEEELEVENSVGMGH